MTSDRAVLIVAHGQPSDPAPAAAELRALAKAVALHLPERVVSSATLAEPEALAEGVKVLGPGGLVYPLFMAGGWFTRTHLPARLAAVGAEGWMVLEPLGCDPALHDLATEVVREALAEGGIAAAKAQLLLAAHGSFRSPAPSEIARKVAGHIAARTGIGRVEVAFIDQEPKLAEAAGFGGNALCLPFFAASGGHVTEDIPSALSQSGFGGKVLPAIGTDARVPALIAEAIRAERAILAMPEGR